VMATDLRLQLMDGACEPDAGQRAVCFWETTIFFFCMR
jgi:hypothetical protein